MPYKKQHIFFKPTLWIFLISCFFFSFSNIALSQQILSKTKKNQQVRIAFVQEDVEAIIVRVIDGDSLVVDIPGFPPVIGKGITVRIASCDTPEKNDAREELRQKAKEAKSFTEKLASPGRRVWLREIRRDKYFRLLAKVEADGVDITSALIEKGLALPYEGGKKKW